MGDMEELDALSALAKQNIVSGGISEELKEEIKRETQRVGSMLYGMDPKKYDSGPPPVVGVNRHTLANTVWEILGEGEKRERLIMGSGAEAIDDALAVAEAVIFEGVTNWDEWCAYNNLDPATGDERDGHRI